ncbi:MAG: hypothetical protein ABW328_05775 [Ilumatobacteraceae bacterium]
MAAPKYSPVRILDDPRSYASPDHVPAAWTGGRPADLDGRQPSGARLGFQGPDQGYALTLAARLRGDVQTQPGESVDDAMSGCTAIALRRASMYGRAPVIHDLRIGFTIWGFLDATPPDALVALRRPLFEGVANSLHHYDERRALVDSVPDATLRMTPAEVATSYPTHWAALLGR